MYAVHDKELAMQCEQLAIENANANLVHYWEIDHVEKDIKPKYAKESLIAKHMEMLFGYTNLLGVA